MPKGFSGRAAVRYLGDVSDAHSRAVSTSSEISSSAPGATQRVNPKQLPHSPEEAVRSSKFTTGTGSSSNIVADSREYEEISRKISQADDKIGECLYRIAQEIEDLCQTSYRLPRTVPRCMGICNNIKRSLGRFRSLTEDALLQTNRFAERVTNIGG
jgi:hypothetical protein